MANSYLEFSEVLTRLTESEASWLQNQLEIVYVSNGNEGADPADATWIGCRAYRDMEDYDPDFGEDVGFSYSFSEKVDENWGRYLWIYSEEHGYVDRVAHLVQTFLRKFRPDQCWSLTYATTCSKPRVGEFGGGAVFVTASDIKYFGAWCFVHEEEKRFKDGKDGKDGTRVVINVSGGVVQDIFCADPQADVIVVDWDTDGCDSAEAGMVEVGKQLAHVARQEVYPLEKLARTDTEEALSLAERKN